MEKKKEIDQTLIEVANRMTDNAIRLGARPHRVEDVPMVVDGIIDGTRLRLKAHGLDI